MKYHTRFSLVLASWPTVFTLLAGSAIHAAEEKKDTLDVNVTPIVTYVSVDGNKGQFRQDNWITDGISGGIESARLSKIINDTTTLDIEAVGIFESERYEVTLSLLKKDVGFVRAGFKQFRRYYSDTGGYYEDFTKQSFELDEDLHMDVGNFFIEFGLTLPDVPKIVIGYERQYRDGQQSLLSWGTVTQGGTDRNIYPSYRDVDETVDIFRAGLERELGKFRIEDQFRYEIFKYDNTRYEKSVNLNNSTKRRVNVYEQYDQDAFFNTFLVESHLTDALYLSLGYLYNNLEGTGDFQVQTPPPLVPDDRNWNTRALDTELKSHVVNLNGMYTIIPSLHLYGGVQAEKTDTDSSADALLANAPSPATLNLINSTSDKTSLRESLGLRFTKIAHTTLYLEGKLTQEDIGLEEKETVNGAPGLKRDTDTDVSRQQYSAGFNSSPIPKLHIAGRYRYTLNKNDYDHNLDNQNGYSAFITAQDFKTDEINAKVTVRPTSRVSLFLQYQYIATDTDTETDSIPFLAPGGSLQSGDYNANLVSVGATVTPISRLFVTGTFTLMDSATDTYSNDSASVARYNGDTYVLSLMTGYAFDAKTDGTVEYTFARSRNETDQPSLGLPLQLDNEYHAVIVSLVRKIRENITARLRYAYYERDEESGGGYTDYTAHLVSASCSLRF
jgi:hypothetical protein